MDILVGDDQDVGLSLKLDEERLIYLCPDNKKEVYEQILQLIGEAFLVRTSNDANPKIIGTDVPNKRARKNLIMEDQKIQGLYKLIKQYKTIGSENATYTEDDPEDEPQPPPNNDGINQFNIYVPDKFIPQKLKDDYLCFSEEEAKTFVFNNTPCDIKICEIIRELAFIRVSQKPVACTCLYRCLLEECARRVFAQNVDTNKKMYDENDLRGNLLYITNNIIFKSLNGSEWDKTRTSLKDKFKGMIDILNLYIHYPNMVDISLIKDSWQTTKIFIIRCLSI